MNKLAIPLLALIPLTAHAQPLSLDSCRLLAHDNYPAIAQYDLISQSRDLSLADAARQWLPNLSLSASAAVFTDILNSDSPASQMGLDLPNHILSASLSLKQNIYDGGQISARKRLNNAQAATQTAQINVAIYDVYAQVEELFFGILLTDEHLRINDLMLNDLATAHKSLTSLLNNGLAQPSDLELLQVQQLQLAQQSSALQSSRHAYLTMLSAFVGRTLDDSTHLLPPPTPDPSPTPCARPELTLFASQHDLLNSKRDQLDARLRPTLAFVGTGLLHSEMSNLLNNGLLAASLQLNWNIGAFYTRRNDLRQLSIQHSDIDVQRATFLFNNNLQKSSTNAKIQTLQSQTLHDAQIVSLRESIMQRANKKLQSGTYSLNDLIRDINAAALARQQMALHQIQLLQESYHLKNINNN